MIVLFQRVKEASIVVEPQVASKPKKRGFGINPLL